MPQYHSTPSHNQHKIQIALRSTTTLGQPCLHQCGQQHNCPCQQHLPCQHHHLPRCYTQSRRHSTVQTSSTHTWMDLRKFSPQHVAPSNHSTPNYSPMPHQHQGHLCAPRLHQQRVMCATHCLTQHAHCVPSNQPPVHIAKRMTCPRWLEHLPTAQRMYQSSQRCPTTRANQPSHKCPACYRQPV